MLLFICITDEDTEAQKSEETCSVIWLVKVFKIGASENVNELPKVTGLEISTWKT